MHNHLPTLRKDISAMVVVALLLVIARGAVLARDISLAAHFGAGKEVDAFNIAFMVVSWPTQLLISVSVIVLVPLLVKLSANEFSAEKERLTSEFYGTVLIIAAGVAILLLIVAEPMALFFAAPLGIEIQNLVKNMIFWFAPSAFFLIIAGFLSARLQALRDHLFTLMEGLPAVGMIVFFPVAAAYIFTIPLSFAIGLAIGGALQVAGLIWLLQRRGEPVKAPKIRHKSAYWQQIYGSMSIMVIGQVILSLSLPIDQYFLARIGEGEVAKFGYASRIVSLALTLGVTVLSRILLPSFSELHSGADSIAARNYAAGWSTLMLLGGLAAAIAGLFAAEPFVELLYGRGEFSQDDVRETAYMVSILLFQIPFFLAGMVLVQYFAARSEYLNMLIGAMISIVVKILAIYILYDNYGLFAVILSSVFVYLSSYLYLIMRLYFHNA